VPSDMGRIHSECSDARASGLTRMRQDDNLEDATTKRWRSIDADTRRVVTSAALARIRLELSQKTGPSFPEPRSRTPT